MSPESSGPQHVVSCEAAMEGCLSCRCRRMVRSCLRTKPRDIPCPTHRFGACAARRALLAAGSRLLPSTATSGPRRWRRGAGHAWVLSARRSGYDARKQPCLAAATRSGKCGNSTVQRRQLLYHAAPAHPLRTAPADPATLLASHAISSRPPGRSLALGARGAVAALTAPHRPRTSPI